MPRPPRKLKYGAEARRALAAGVDLVGQTVRPTLGPRGRLVTPDTRFGAPELSPSYIDRKLDSPLLADDGHAVAQEILIGDTFVNQGVLLARDAGRGVKLKVGDGSTTAILLTQALVHGGLRAVDAGFEARAVERGMELASDQALARLAGQARAVSGREQLTHVATSAAGGDRELGELVAGALEQVGRGHVAFEPSRRVESSLTVHQDYVIDRGLLAPAFVTDQDRQQSILENAYVLIVDAPITRSTELVSALDLAAAAGRPILLFAEDFDADALALLTVNVINHRVVAVPVKSPGYGASRQQLLGDVAALTGAVLVGGAAQRALTTVKAEDLGQAGRIVVDRHVTRIAEGRGRRETVAMRVGCSASTRPKRTMRTNETNLRTVAPA